jgi:aminopeptidase N
MMANFLGKEVFNMGVEFYLRRHKFKNAKPVATRYNPQNGVSKSTYSV